jgi:multiple sugar transport system ATP-binding protein
MNLLSCALRQGGGELSLDFGEAGRLDIANDPALTRRCRAVRQQELIFGARPEDMEIAPADGPSGLAGTVTFVEPIGPRTIVHLEVNGTTIKVAKEKLFRVAIGKRVTAVPPRGKCHLFDVASGDALGLS